MKKEENGGTKETERLIYESSLRVFDIELQRTNDLDNKSSTLLAVGSTIIAIFVGLGSLSIKELSESDYYFLLLVTLISGIMAIFSSLLYTLEIYNPLSHKLREYKAAPDPQFLISEYSDKSERVVIKRLTATIAKAWKIDLEINDKKTIRIARAFFLLEIGIGLMILYAIMFIILIR